jgi:hypothetical protein
MEAAVDRVAVCSEHQPGVLPLGQLAAYVSRHPSLAAHHRLANLEPLELRMILIQRLVVPCPTMRGRNASDLVHASKVARFSHTVLEACAISRA